VKNRLTPLRRAQLAKIHIAKKELGLDDETYRSMLWTIARVRSASDLDSHACARVLEHLKSRGFTGIRARKEVEGRPHNLDASPQLKKIEALLTDAQRPWAYANGVAKRMFSIDRVAFCGPEQLGKIIAALSIDQRRRKSITTAKESSDE